MFTHPFLFLMSALHSALQNGTSNWIKASPLKYHRLDTWAVNKCNSKRTPLVVTLMSSKSLGRQKTCTTGALLFMQTADQLGQFPRDMALQALGHGHGCCEMGLRDVIRPCGEAEMYSMAQEVTRTKWETIRTTNLEYNNAYRDPEQDDERRRYAS